MNTCPGNKTDEGDFAFECSPRFTYVILLKELLSFVSYLSHSFPVFVILALSVCLSLFLSLSFCLPVFAILALSLSRALSLSHTHSLYLSHTNTHTGATGEFGESMAEGVAGK